MTFPNFFSTYSVTLCYGFNHLQIALLQKERRQPKRAKRIAMVEIASAAVIIQRWWRKQKMQRDLEKEKAAIKIQAVYKGFNARKAQNEHLISLQENDELPDLCNADTLAAALKIQSAFKGYRVRKIQKVPMTPQSSIDFENIPPPSENSTNLNSKRVPPVPTRFDSSKKIPKNNISTSETVPNVQEKRETIKTPILPRSNKLKEVAIPKVPPKKVDILSASQGTSNQEEQVKSHEEPSFMQQSLLRKESLTNFFKKQSETPSPTTPPDRPRERERSFAKTLKEASTTIRSRSKSKERETAPLSLPSKVREEPKSKIGGFFSSMFKKTEKIKVTSPEAVSPNNDTLTNVKFKFNESSDKETPEPKNSSEVSLAIETGIINEHNQKKEANSSNLKPSTSRKKEENQKEVKSVSKTENSKTDALNGVQDDLKNDLIHVVLSAVEENWLNQAPKPTLDKVKALQAQDSDPELENSERSTSEADYVKKKIKAQKSDDLGSEDEGARLCRQESGDGEFPFVETTLPQEKSGTVSITPSNQRLSECKLSSIDRPRSLSPRKAGKLEDYVQGQKSNDKEQKIQVKLPRQESKGKILKSSKGDNESWDKFTAAGLQSPRQSRNIKPTTKINSSKKPQTKSESKKAWVDCEKLPETKKTTKKYGTDAAKRRSGDMDEPSLQTLSGTQIVSPDECSCDCHHDTPPRVKSPPTSSKPCNVPTQPPKGIKPKTNPRTTSVTARTKPIPSLKSKEAGAASSSSSRPGPPPVPVRTTSVSKPIKQR